MSNYLNSLQSPHICSGAKFYEVKFVYNVLALEALFIGDVKKLLQLREKIVVKPQFSLASLCENGVF